MSGTCQDLQTIVCRLQGHGRRRDTSSRDAALGEAGEIIAGGRCAVPGGMGEAPCRDLPSPGHMRRAGTVGCVCRALPDTIRAAQGECLSSGRGLRWSEIFSFASWAASFQLLLLWLKLCQEQTSGGAGLCRSHASVSLLAKGQE